VRLTGRLVDSVGPGQERELQVDEVELLGDCDTLVWSFIRFQPQEMISRMDFLYK
jgi:hypothetical protein